MDASPMAIPETPSLVVGIKLAHSTAGHKRPARNACRAVKGYRLNSKSDTYFTRLMSFMLNALNGSIKTELVRFFDVVHGSYSLTKLVGIKTFIFRVNRQVNLLLHGMTFETLWEFYRFPF